MRVFISTGRPTSPQPRYHWPSPLALRPAHSKQSSCNIVPIEGVKGGPDYLVASTVAGGNPSGTLWPTPGVHYQYYFRIKFTAPGVPLPGYFTGTLVVTWPGGSALLELSGTTAQITATLLDIPPVEVGPALDPGTIHVNITYYSGDSSDLTVDIRQASPPTAPVNFSVTPVHVTMLPHLHLITVNNPKTPFPMRFPIEVPGPTRTAIVPVFFYASTSGKGYIQVSAPDSHLPDPPPIEVTLKKAQ